MWKHRVQDLPSTRLLEADCLFNPLPRFSGQVLGGVLLAALCASLAGAGSALAQTAQPATAPLAAHTAEASELETLSDQQLTNLAADWRALDGPQRSELIQETRGRMQPGGAQPAVAAAGSGARPSSAIPSSAIPSSAPLQQTQTIERRRFGRLVRQPDGSVVRIQAEVVRVVRRDPKRAYGVGFERRHLQPGERAQETPSRMQMQLDNSRLQPQRADVLTVQDPGS